MEVRPASPNGKPTTVRHAGNKTELNDVGAVAETAATLPHLHGDRESRRPPDEEDYLRLQDEVEVQCPRAEGGTCVRRGGALDPGSLIG